MRYHWMILFLFKTYDDITRHSNYVLNQNWQKQRQTILSTISKHDQSYLDEANAMQVNQLQSNCTHEN